jgi:hypothetical protein
MKEQISRLQFLFLMYWLINGDAILMLPLTILQFVIHDAWMVGLTFILGAFAVSAVVHIFVRVFPGQNDRRAANGFWFMARPGAGGVDDHLDISSHLYDFAEDDLVCHHQLFPEYTDLRCDRRVYGTADLRGV